MFRLEAETSYKRAGINTVRFDPTYFGVTSVDAGGNASALSAMVNALARFRQRRPRRLCRRRCRHRAGEVQCRRSGTATGPGFSDRDRAVACRLLAGVRTAISDNLDVGLKYRYFQTGRLDFRR